MFDSSKPSVWLSLCSPCVGRWDAARHWSFWLAFFLTRLEFFFLFHSISAEGELSSCTLRFIRDTVSCLILLNTEDKRPQVLSESDEEKTLSDNNQNGERNAINLTETNRKRCQRRGLTENIAGTKLFLRNEGFSHESSKRHNPYFLHPFPDCLFFSAAVHEHQTGKLEPPRLLSEEMCVVAISL